jgi:hypothetical protein
MEMNESLLSKLLLATVPAIVIAYATNVINKKQAAGEKQEIRHELAVQLAKSLELSNEKLNHWIEKYETLSNKYDELRQRTGSVSGGRRPASGSGAGSGTGSSGVASATLRPDDEPAPPSARAADVAGTWKTPDGTVVWSFANGRLQVSSTELLPGMLSGSGTYRQTGEAVQALDGSPGHGQRGFPAPLNRPSRSRAPSIVGFPRPFPRTLVQRSATGPDGPRPCRARMPRGSYPSRNCTKMMNVTIIT